MIRINQIKIPIKDDQNKLNLKIRKLLKITDNIDYTYEIVKRSIDARKKDQLMYIYSVDVKCNNEKHILSKIHDNNIMLTSEEKYSFSYNKYQNQKIIIIGAGPAGLFCGLFLARAGYCPIIFERGMDVDKRTAIVEHFWNSGELNPISNVQFGEGGAGTFSDGKLNTAVKDKTGRIREILKTFVEFGANPNILYINKPHVGTDVLALVVKNIRNEIIKLGGEIHFESKLTNIYYANNHVKGIQINDCETYDCDELVLAIGHSARDTFERLFELDIPMETKAFAVGMRVEHNQNLINNYMYGNTDHKNLSAADYKVTAKAFNERGVYSFCMCPGGYVVNASSEKDMLCVNGMSYSGRNGKNANSAIVVTVNPSDFNSKDILAGMHFQRRLEGLAFKAGNGCVPIQLNEDFVKGLKSTSIGSVAPQIKGKYQFGNLRDVLPEYISESIIDGMKTFDKIIKGFNAGDAVFSGVESRTSSPLRILRNDTLECISVKGIYPCGEGAGYAGGITSAAVDGLKVAEAIANKQIG